MYREIKEHPGTRALYAKALEKEGVLRDGEEAELISMFRDKLDRGHRWSPRSPTRSKASWRSTGASTSAPTGPTTPKPQVSAERIAALGQALAQVPPDFTPHRAVERVLKTRLSMSRGEQPVDWGMGETLAYATLLEDGFDVRLDGQDAGRGTFVHRHAVLHNQTATDAQNEEYLPLAHLPGVTCRIEVIDSTLSEEAVMAFDYGYSTSAPESLGDLGSPVRRLCQRRTGGHRPVCQRRRKQMAAALGADLAAAARLRGRRAPNTARPGWSATCNSAPRKTCRWWCRQSASQMFHLLRRQMIRPYRKPLIIMSPKSLLQKQSGHVAALRVY